MSNFQCITTSRAKELLEQGAQVADIRDPNAFQNGHPKGAYSLNNENLQDFLAEADMDAPTLVFCYHGISSQSAAGFLAERGFDDVYSVNGGYEAWHADFPDLCESGE